MNEPAIRSAVHHDRPAAFPFHRAVMNDRVDATHQAILAHTDAHLAVHHEHPSTKHRFFFHLRDVRKRRLHSTSENRICCHGVSYLGKGELSQ